MSGVISGTTLAEIMGGAAGIGALGNLGSAYIGSQAAGQAAQNAVQGQNNALIALLGGQTSAVGALQPYATQGLENYDFLNYLLGTGGTGGGAGTVQPLTQDQLNQMASLQSYITNYPNTRGGQSGKYAGALASAQSQLQALQQQQQAYQAQQGATTAEQQSGLAPGYFLSAAQTPFTYNALTDPGLANASQFANNQIAAQFAAGGGTNSGNMASAIAQEDAGTLEPTFYNQALQNYQQNYVSNPTQLYNMLTGNVGGAGQNAANALSNIYTGTASNAGQNLTGIGNAQAAGTLGANNAITNALTGTGNQATSLAGNYLSLMGLQGLLGGNSTYNLNNTGYGGGINAMSNYYQQNPSAYYDTAGLPW